MKPASTILIVDSEVRHRAQIASLCKTLGHPYVEAGDAEEALTALQKHKIGLLVSSLFLKRMSLTDFLDRAHRIRRNMETIVISPVVTANTSYLMRKLGVFRLLKKPWTLEDLQDAVITGLASRRVFRLAVQGKYTEPQEGEKARIVIAHEDDQVFENLLKSVLAEGYTIETARDFDHLEEKMKTNYVDILLTGPEYAENLLGRMGKSDTPFPCEPSLWLVSASPKALSRFRRPARGFSEFQTRQFPVARDQLLSSLQKSLRQVQKVARTGAFRKHLRFLWYRFVVAHSIFGAPFFVFYLIILTLAGFFGYLATRDARASRASRSYTAESKSPGSPDEARDASGGTSDRRMEDIRKELREYRRRFGTKPPEELKQRLMKGL